MKGFAAAYFTAVEVAAGSQAKWKNLHAELYRLLSPPVARFVELLDSEDEDGPETAEDFRADLNDYVRKNGFLAQIIPYQDPESEQLHLYGRYLLHRLPSRADGAVDIGEIDLSHLRVDKTGERTLQKEAGYDDAAWPASPWEPVRPSANGRAPRRSSGQASPSAARTTKAAHACGVTFTMGPRVSLESRTRIASAA